MRLIKLVATLAADLAAGFGLLTRLPVGWLVRPGMPYRPARAVWCYPLAGALVGSVSWLSLLIGRESGLPHALAAAWALAATVCFTGALHEDGLADLADGCGGGRTARERLEIMRDSRIGAFGALALVLSIGIRLAALDRVAVLPTWRQLDWLLAAGALSRSSMLPVLLLPAARADGLGRSVGAVGRPVLALALAIGAAVALGLPCWRAAAAAILLALLTGCGMAGFARARLGGQTGDVLGACVAAADCVLLTLAAGYAPPG